MCSSFSLRKHSVFSAPFHSWCFPWSPYCPSVICLASSSVKLPVLSVYIEHLILLEDFHWDFEIRSRSDAVFCRALVGAPALTLGLCLQQGLCLCLRTAVSWVSQHCKKVPSFNREHDAGVKKMKIYSSQRAGRISNTVKQHLPTAQLMSPSAFVKSKITAVDTLFSCDSFFPRRPRSPVWESVCLPLRVACCKKLQIRVTVKCQICTNGNSCLWFPLSLR